MSLISAYLRRLTNKRIGHTVIEKLIQKVYACKPKRDTQCYMNLEFNTDSRPSEMHNKYLRALPCSLLPLLTAMSLKDITTALADCQGDNVDLLKCITDWLGIFKHFFLSLKFVHRISSYRAKDLVRIQPFFFYDNFVI